MRPGILSLALRAHPVPSYKCGVSLPRVCPRACLRGCPQESRSKSRARDPPFSLSELSGKRRSEFLCGLQTDPSASCGCSQPPGFGLGEQLDVVWPLPRISRSARGQRATISSRGVTLRAIPQPMIDRSLGVRPFSLMMGVRKRAFSGVFIEENAHRSRSPCLHLQGKWSSCFLQREKR